MIPREKRQNKGAGVQNSYHGRRLRTLMRSSSTQLMPPIDHFHNVQCRYICMVLQSAFGFHLQVFKLQTGFLPLTYKAVTCRVSALS